MSDSDDGHQRGTETDVDQPMGGNEPKPQGAGKAKMGTMTKNQEFSGTTMTKNAVLDALKGLSEEEFFSVAPAGIQQTLNSAKEVVEKERVDIIGKLTANVKNPQDRKAKILKLKDKSLPDLRELLEFSTLNSSTENGKKVPSAKDSEETFLANFFGSGASAPVNDDHETVESVQNRRGTGAPLYPNLSVHDEYEDVG